MSVTTFNAVTRATMLEYANVLVNLDQIISSYSKTDSTGLKVANARLLISLMRLLRDMQATGLTGSPVLNNLSKTVTNRAQALENLIDSGASDAEVAMGFDSFIYSNYGLGVKTSVVNDSLDPSNWYDTTTGQLVSIQDSLSDFAFFEVYRHADASLIGSMGQLANRLEASKQFLKALNNIYAGSAWNPGIPFISLTGELQDYIDSTGAYRTWYGDFINDQISNKMTDGISNLSNLKDSGLLPTDSLEYSTAVYLIDIFNKNYDDGGYSAVATADAARRMWGDKQFRLSLQNGIDATTRLNEERQLDISRLISQYDFFVRACTNLVSRDGDILRNIANHVKDN